MTSRLLLILLSGFSINALAYDDANVCDITKDTVLTAHSAAHCQNFRIAPGVTVVTHEYNFIRRTDDNYVCGTTEQPCHIKCVGENDSYDMKGKLCGRTDVQAVIAHGATDIENEDGIVSLAFAGYGPGYRQRVIVGENGRASLHLADQNVTKSDSRYRWFN